MTHKIINIFFLSFFILVSGCNDSPSDLEPNNKNNNINSENDPDSQTDNIYILWTEDNINVGEISISKESEHILAKIKTTGKYLTEAKLHVADSPTQIPQEDGEIIPERFEYSLQNSDCLTEITYPLPIIDDNNDGTVYIAAHGIVANLSENTEFYFPNNVEMDYYGDTNYSYPSAFNIKINVLDAAAGIYDGWCMGYLVTFNYGVYSAAAFPIYIDNELNSELNHYKNLDKINWIINQHFAGKEAECGGTISSQDIQVAIWELLDQFTDPGWSSEFWAEECKVAEIIDSANLYGQGFIPKPGDYMGVILEPENGFQPALIEVKIPYNFTGKLNCWAGSKEDSSGIQNKFIEVKLK